MRYTSSKEEEKEEEEDEEHGQNVEIIVSDIVYILHHNTTNFCILANFHTFFTLLSLKVLKLNMKIKNILIYGL